MFRTAVEHAKKHPGVSTFIFIHNFFFLVLASEENSHFVKTTRFDKVVVGALVTVSKMFQQA